MELCSRVLAEVETGDAGPGVFGPSPLVTEGSGGLVPDSVVSPRSIADVAGASLSHPDTAGLMGATLRALITNPSQMLGSIGATVNPDVHADVLASESCTVVRHTQPLHTSLVVDVPSGYPEDFETFGTLDTDDIRDILSVDVTPLVSISTSGMHAVSCPDMSVAASMSVDLGTSMSVDFDDRMREIQDTSTSDVAIAGAYYSSIRNPSLAPNVGRARLGDTTAGTHPLTVLGPTSLGDTASGGFPLMALGRYTEPDDSFAQAQTRFWTRASKRDRGVDSGSDFLFTEFDSRSALDRYFAKEGTKRGSVAAASADVQVGHSPWTWRNPSPTQGGPHPSSDPSQLPPQFKKPKTPPPRTVVATTRTEMYMRHTSQVVMVTSPTGHRRSSSSCTSTDSRIPPPPQTSRSSVQQWLDALDT